MVQYKYDAWGKCATVVLDDAASVIAELNPFRYRSYYLDTETGLYFLKTRYYDPITGRFLTPDSVEYLAPETIGGLNLYAYCNNNPVMNVDPDGRFVISLGVIALALTIGLGMAATANDIYQIAAGNLTIIPSESGKTFQLSDSYKIVTPWMQWGYSFYLNHFNPETKDIMQGTTRGAQLEWMWHNLAYYGSTATKTATDWLGWEGVSEKLSVISKSAVNADFGFNVFADNPGVPGIAMKILNFFAAPLPTIIDGILYLTKYERG